MTFTDRYAPSPTSDLHLGNLRTALAGWLLTRAAGGTWRMRIEDLDRDRVRAAEGVEGRQLRDLESLGLTWDGPLVRQSERLDLYRDAVASLPTYECFCTRREIAEAASAPHDDGYRPYAGTCRGLTGAERDARRAERPAAIRLDARAATQTIQDEFAGQVTSVVDDVVLVRGDGQFAYNLAVVVDDIAMGVDHITRGDDLLSSAPRQARLTTLLGGTPARYAHIGLVTNATGRGSPSGTVPSPSPIWACLLPRRSPCCAPPWGWGRATQRKKRWPPCLATSASTPGRCTPTAVLLSPEHRGCR
ncbi:glutamate--tRNA ligase family protein [Tessaracoccus defluvii]|uniref:glutamate--tRNA ligase family protein n=1 Tax=Tessaracoccus defluvii TaxID=1285901 RepID=UPI001D039372|nr:glutamate--tRNA ligase family protein [Tessaracoccus defluvii]